ncbi:transcription elongation factor, mitochondrial isoform X2 [Pseudophryne corroboree]|uniref:transcription elongation factor, mitochondrial isoform X2 n=1 Tax=Pseudophryne corroboree TaxID=495146 RepID=UPI003081AEDC
MSHRLFTTIGRSPFVRSCAINLLERRTVHCTRCLWKLDIPMEKNSAAEEIEESMDQAYSAQQRDTILHMLNTVSERQLKRVKVLQGGMSAQIIQYREAHGPFLDLDTLSKVADVKHIKKLCDSMLSNTASSRERGQTAKFIKPDISMHRLQTVESIVSIVFGLKKIAWAHVDRNMTVKDWQQHEWLRFMKGKQQPEVYLEDVSSAVSKLPEADIYIMEKPAISFQSTTLFPVMLHLHTVEAMLYAMLNPCFTADQDHRVFSMARNIVGKHFDIMVGESKTSGVNIVQRLVDEAVTREQPRIYFTQDIIQQYKHKFQSRGQNRNEEMCDALLQAVTFYELATSRILHPE